jgi:hypothetical protein
MTVLLSILLPLLLVGYGIYAVVRRGFEMAQLVKDGVEATGRWRQNWNTRRQRLPPQHAPHPLRVPGCAGPHTHPYVHDHLDFWNAHVEGGPITIVYSAAARR